MTAQTRSQSEAAGLAPGSEFAGYRIERLLDRGGMGIVYVATEIDLGRTVALKVIAPEHTCDVTAVARFRAESRLAASLVHPNVVPIHRGGECDGVLFLAMRFVSGTNLRSVIDRGPMEVGRVGRVITQLGAALDAAHACGLIHRDVKPANVLVEGDGDSEHVFLTDFGLTKRLGATGGLTRSGDWIGTPDYVAPEQIQGHDVDRRADVYSLGCVLFEMLTGHVAYPKDSDMAKLWAHVTDPPPLPSTRRGDLVEEFDAVVAKATAKDPERRYATAGEMTAAVRSAIAAQEATRREHADQPTFGSDVAAFGATVAERSIAEPPSVPASVAPPPAVPSGPAPAGRRSQGAPRFVVAVAVIAAVVGGVILMSCMSPGHKRAGAAPVPRGDEESAHLGAVATNRVSAAGDVSVRLDGDVATVTLDTTGLLDGGPHPLHIHASGRGVCPPASAAKPHNGHVAISTLDGIPFYGRPVTALTTRGDTTAKSILALRRYPHSGNVRYRRTLRLGKVVASYIRRNNAVVVIHGIDYNHNFVYDNGLDRSDLKRSLPGELTAPALCGPLVAARKPAGSANTATTAQGPGSQYGVYSASLRQDAGAPDPAWLCPLHRASDGPGIAT